MNSFDLMVLLEVDNGCYHACQIGRGSGHPSHSQADQAIETMLKQGLIQWVGNELLLTAEGRDIIDRCRYGSRQSLPDYTV